MQTINVCLITIANEKAKFIYCAILFPNPTLSLQSLKSLHSTQRNKVSTYKLITTLTACEGFTVKFHTEG